MDCWVSAVRLIFYVEAHMVLYSRFLIKQQ